MEASRGGDVSDSSHSDISRLLQLRDRMLVSDSESEDDIAKLCQIDVFQPVSGNEDMEETELTMEYMEPKWKDIMTPDMLYNDFFIEEESSSENNLQKKMLEGWADSSDSDFDPKNPQEFGFKCCDKIYQGTKVNMEEIMMEFGTLKVGAFILADSIVYLVEDFVEKRGFFGKQVTVDSGPGFDDVYILHELSMGILSERAYYDWKSFKHIKPATFPWFQYSITFSGENPSLASEIVAIIHNLSPGLAFSIVLGDEVISFRSRSEALFFILDQLFNSKDRITSELTSHVSFNKQHIDKIRLAGDPNIDYEPPLKCPGLCGFFTNKRRKMIQHILKSTECQEKRKEILNDFVANNATKIDHQLHELRVAQFTALGNTRPSAITTSFESKMDKMVYESLFGFEGWIPDKNGYKRIIDKWDEYVKVMGITAFNKNTTARGTTRKVGISKKGPGAKVQLLQTVTASETFHKIKICISVA